MFGEEQGQTSTDADAAGRTVSVRVTIDDDEPPAPGGNEMGIFGPRADGSRARLRDIPVAVLKENLHRAVAGFHEAIAGLPQGELPLKEAQVAFEVTATGGIAFAATAQTAVRGCITLTFGA